MNKILHCGLITFLVFQSGLFGQISEEEALRQAQQLLQQLGYDDGKSTANHYSDEPGNHSNPAHTSFSPLTVEQIQSNQDVWPARIVMIEAVEFNNGVRLTPGNQLDFMGFTDNGDVILDHRGGGLVLPPAFTDIEERANNIASGQAKAEGYQGRLIEQLNGRVDSVANRLQKASTEELAGADAYLLYMSSSTCGWCKQFTPEVKEAVEKARRDFPGKLKFIHASVDRNRTAYEPYIQSLGADLGIPPGDRYFIDFYSTTNPPGGKINQPSLMLVNANGRILEHGQRQDRDTRQIEQVLDSIESYLENPKSIQPTWMNLSAPLTTHKEQNISVSSISPDQVTPNTDPGLQGPLPYEVTLRNGEQVPGLMLVPTNATGTKIPALTAQKFFDPNGDYYVLSFREIKGNTRNDPLLMQWIRYTSVTGAGARDSLEEGIQQFKDLAQKFREWRQTAIDNEVSNFRKEIAKIEGARLVNPITLSAIAIPGQTQQMEPLSITFQVQEDPAKATLLSKHMTFMPATLDAFLRTADQLDALISHLPGEVQRLEMERADKVKKVQDIDSLFQ